MSFNSSSFSTSTGEAEDWLKYHPKGREKVLLREVEICRVCAKKFLSLYPLKSCADHSGLDEF
jgi:hypothetical protein